MSQLPYTETSSGSEMRPSPCPSAAADMSSSTVLPSPCAHDSRPLVTFIRQSSTSSSVCSVFCCRAATGTSPSPVASKDSNTSCVSSSLSATPLSAMALLISDSVSMPSASESTLPSSSSVVSRESLASLLRASATVTRSSAATSACVWFEGAVAAAGDEAVVAVATRSPSHPTPSCLQQCAFCSAAQELAGDIDVSQLQGAAVDTASCARVACKSCRSSRALPQRGTFVLRVAAMAAPNMGRQRRRQ
mmetsp:Transcript_36068/g.107099  ORF Transcript_36068/g.107099 Transcript_36068/m.107099 type:complete len:248 (+) Transcript_36068:231-974(+)